jgi:hypothetical protein
MNKIKIYNFQPCTNSDHWWNMMIDGKCFTCKAEFAEFLADDEMKHKELPSDEEIENMARSAHEEYITAH